MQTKLDISKEVWTKAQDEQSRLESEIMLGEITIQKMATELKEKQVRQIAMHAQCQVQIKRAEEWKQDFMTGQDGMKKIMEQYKDAVIVIDWLYVDGEML